MKNVINLESEKVRLEKLREQTVAPTKNLVDFLQSRRRRRECRRYRELKAKDPALCKFVYGG